MAQHRWIDPLTAAEVTAVHDASLAILAHTGIVFADDTALCLFKRHGARVSGQTVYLPETLVNQAIAAAPAQVTVRARPPRSAITIGSSALLTAPGYGAPFIMDAAGPRLPTRQDYDTLVRLVDALPNQDISGFLLAQPADVPACRAHLHMLHSHMTLSAKPFLGSSAGAEAAQQTMEMAGILFGDTAESLRAAPVALALVDSLSPLQYDPESCGALLTYAGWRQPVILSALLMAGATGPITLAGCLAQQNAELLAGLTLAQLHSPGTPVIYGSTSTIMDMRTGNLAIGSPELALLAAAAAQLARLYGLPCRGGGSLTDAHAPDAQAGWESAVGLLTAVYAGVDLVLHAAGILSSFLAVSLDKLVLDDELCGLARAVRRGLPVSAGTLAAEVIAAAGPGGSFLETDHTLQRCRTEFWQPALANRQGVEPWLAAGSQTAVDRARARRQRLLADFEPPPLDPSIARDLQAYVASRGC